MLVLSEFSDGKVVAVEHLMSSAVQSIKECNANVLSGYSANIYQEMGSGESVAKV